MNASQTPALFASVRSSKDVTLVAFAAAIFAAFALHAGALLPRLDASGAAGGTAAIEVARKAPAPRVAARRPTAPRSTPAAAAEVEPCPRG